MRRNLKFQSLCEVLIECERLLNGGYIKNGNWTLGQICHHLRRTIEANMNGYPVWMTAVGYPLRPFLRWLVLPRLLHGRSPKGIKTAPMFVPPDGLDDARELQKFSDCIHSFECHNKRLHAHPGFGRLTKSGFQRFHAAHAGHHLSFLDDSK